MTEDTIAAIATAMGEGGIGIVRISGERSKEILDEIFIPISKHIENRNDGFFPKSTSETVGAPIQSRRLTYGHIKDEKGELIDEVLAVYMKAPYTYTAEDVVEINCHGSIVSLRKTLALVLRKGARIAEPGEFTKRAFLNGRLDLSQAEAVMDLISAKTDKGYDIALGQLSGSLSKHINEIRKKVLDLLVEITVNIDYPDEDIEEITYEKLIKSLSQIGDGLDSILSTADAGKIIRDGFNVVIVGKPNVGKSSLMNMLLRESRAIVTEIAGTTRDTIEEVMSIRGIPIRLTDTAGIRDTDDKIEQIGIERSKGALEKADLVIFMLDSARELDDEDLAIIEYIKDRKVLTLLNKSDLDSLIDEQRLNELLPETKVIYTSIVNDRGLCEIEDEIESLVFCGDIKQGESLLLTNSRHISLLENSLSAIGDGLEAARLSEALDIVEIDVRRAYDFLGEIVGETASDDIIDEVFSRFCLGK